MDTRTADFYWQSIPIGQKNAATYEMLMSLWGIKDRREVRRILQMLSDEYEAFDGYALVRSGRFHGFFRTNDKKILEPFYREIERKAHSLDVQKRKVQNVLNRSEGQLTLF